jgi:hypothetical protein
MRFSSLLGEEQPYMNPCLRVRAGHYQRAGISSVDCAMTVFLPMILAAAVLSDLSTIISPSVQKVILAALIWPVLSFYAASHADKQ